MDILHVFYTSMYAGFTFIVSVILGSTITLMVSHKSINPPLSSDIKLLSSPSIVMPSIVTCVILAIYTGLYLWFTSIY